MQRPQRQAYPVHAVIVKDPLRHRERCLRPDGAQVLAKLVAVDEELDAVGGWLGGVGEDEGEGDILR
jgi:hypothetical protein